MGISHGVAMVDAGVVVPSVAAAADTVTVPRDVLVSVVALLRAYGHQEDGVLGDVLRALAPCAT